MEEKTNFGKFIQLKRKNKGLSQKEMADKLYVTESAVSKWERGISYPDISMIQNICRVLSVTEHELLTASDDYRQRETEKHARSFLKISRIYSIILYALYLCSLIPCFIVNLCLSHKLSWFFIVLFSEMVAFSLLNVPVIVKYHKGLWTVGSFYFSLNILLAVCCIYVGGDWYPVTFLSVTFGMAIIFVPLILLDKIFPEKIRRHSALISIGLDSILLIILCMVTVPGLISLKVCVFQLILPWSFLVIIRYTKINGLFKTAACLALAGACIIIQRPILNVLLDNESFSMDPVNFSVWDYRYLNGNITMIVFISCIFVSLLFTAGGIFKTVRNKK